MKAKKWWVLAAIFICCILSLSIVVYGISLQEKMQIENFGTSTLKGLDGIFVSALLFCEGKGQVISLTKKDLQLRVEDDLRKAGIKIDEKSTSKLLILVKVQRFTDLEKLGDMPVPVYFFTLSTILCQHVELARDHKIRTSAITWPMRPTLEESITLAGIGEVEGAIKRQLDNRISEFINDYLAANPKKPSTKNNQGKKQ